MINNKFIHFSEIALIKVESGKIYCDSLWAKDIKEHLDYLLDFSLCCPIIYVDGQADPKEFEKLIGYGFGGVTDISDFDIKHIYELKRTKGWFSYFANFFPNFLRVTKACREAEVVSSAGAGWPFPSSYYILVIRLLYRFKWVMFVESAFFLLNKDEKFNLRRFVGHYVHRALVRSCVKAADARIFITNSYKNYFLNSNDRARVEGITFLNSDDFISEDLMQIKQRKQEKNYILKLIIAGRLIETKGIYILFQAITNLESLGIKAQIDVMGSGSLENECREFVKLPRKNVKMSFLKSLSYGKDFFECLRKYDALLLPSLSDEQPRIIYDAFSQGLSIIGSNTTGIMSVCKNNENAILFEVGDSRALCDAIAYAAHNPEKITQLATNGLAIARTKTHQQIHKDRGRFLMSTLKLN